MTKKYVQLVLQTLGGKKRFWAEKIGKGRYIKVDKTGDRGSKLHYIMGNSTDIVSERPAKIDLHYGELKLENVGMIKLKDLIAEAIPDLRTLPKGSTRRAFNKARKVISKLRVGQTGKQFAREYMMWKVGGERGPEPAYSGPRRNFIKGQFDDIFRKAND